MPNPVIPDASPPGRTRLGWRPAFIIAGAWLMLVAIATPLAGHFWPEDGRQAALLGALVGALCAASGYVLIAVTSAGTPQLLLAGVAGGALIRLVMVASAVFLVGKFPEATGIRELAHFGITTLIFCLSLLFLESGLLANAVATRRPQ